MTSKRTFNITALVMLGLTTMSMMTGCPAGTKTSVDLGVQVTVTPDGCKEDRTATSAPPDLAVLDCTSVQGGGTVRILFPRQEWQSMKGRRFGEIDAGPGK